MGFSLIWPVVLTLLAGGIVIMYLLKQHAEEYKVPSLFLWTEMYKNQTSDKPWEKLKKNILMVLQIMTLIILVIALMGPYIKFGKGDGSTVMLVIDNSASMESSYKGDTSRLEAAKADAEKLIKSLAADVQVAVITSSNEANVVISATSDRTAAIAAVKAVTQSERSGSSEAGVETAKALYNAYNDAALVIFTDTYVSTADLNASIYDYSGDLENSAVSYVFTEDNGDDTYTVVAGISNYGILTNVTSVDLYEIAEDGSKKMIATRDVTVAGGETVQVDFSDVSINLSGIAVGLGSEDDLASDNMYYSALNIKSDANVLLYTQSNTFLEKAIKLVEGVNLVTSYTASGYEAESGYKLYILDCQGVVDISTLPDDGNIMIIGTATGLETGTVNYSMMTGKNEYGTYNVPVNSTYTYLLPSGADSLFETEDGSSAGYIGEINGRKICMIGFDLHSTDFPLTVNFPILMHSIIKELTDTSPVDQTNIAPGDTVKVALNNMTESVILAPDGKSTKVDALDRFTDTEELGCYTVKGANADEDTVFTVNFASSESNVQKMEADTDADVDIKAGGGNGTLNLRNIIIAIAMALLIAEWIIYIRQ